MATTHKGSSTRRDLNYPDPLNGIKVMIEFARPSHDIMIVNVTFMNQKANALTDFNSTPVQEGEK